MSTIKQDETEIKNNTQEEKQRSVFYNYMLAFTIALGGFYLGYYISIFNPIGNPFLTQKFSIFSVTELDSVMGN